MAKWSKDVSAYLSISVLFVMCFSQLSAQSVRNKKPPAMRVRLKC